MGCDVWSLISTREHIASRSSLNCLRFFFPFATLLLHYTLSPSSVLRDMHAWLVGWLVSDRVVLVVLEFLIFPLSYWNSNFMSGRWASFCLLTYFLLLLRLPSPRHYYETYIKMMFRDVTWRELDVHRRWVWCSLWFDFRFVPYEKQFPKEGKECMVGISTDCVVSTTQTSDNRKSWAVLVRRYIFILQLCGYYWSMCVGRNVAKYFLWRKLYTKNMLVAASLF